MSSLFMSGNGPSSAIGFGSSGLVNTSYVPPFSLLGTPNMMQQSEEEVLKTLALCVVGWIAYALAVRGVVRTFGGPKFSQSYAAHIVSGTHGLLAAMLCLRNVLTRYSQSKSNASFFGNIVCVPEPQLADEQLAVCFIAGYFVYDTIFMFVGHYASGLYLLHHVLALGLMFTSMFTRSLGQEVAVGIFLFECTTPLLNVRWLLQFHGFDKEHGDSWRWWFCDTFYLAFFFFARIMCAGSCVLSYYFCSQAQYHTAALLTMLIAGSTAFFISSAKKTSKGIHWLHE